MQSWMIKNMVVPFIMKFINDLLTGENVVAVLDKLFDFIEDVVVDSKTTYDDAIILPAISRLRELLNVPDND